MYVDVPTVGPTTARSRRRLAIGVGAVLVIAAAVAGVWWLTHPATFLPVGNRSIAQIPGDAATGLSFGMTYPSTGGSDREVTIRSATANVAEGSAPVDTAPARCAWTGSTWSTATASGSAPRTPA